MKNIEIKNIALSYIHKVHPHLYTRDGETFMKVIPVANLALRIHFGKEPSVRIINNLESYGLVSSQEKTYLSPYLKEYFFPSWGERYYAVKGGKKFTEFFEEVRALIDLEVENFDRDFILRTEKAILKLLSEYFE